MALTPNPAKRTCSLSQIWEREQVRFAGQGGEGVKVNE